MGVVWYEARMNNYINRKLWDVISHICPSMKLLSKWIHFQSGKGMWNVSKVATILFRPRWVNSYSLRSGAPVFQNGAFLRLCSGADVEPCPFVCGEFADRLGRSIGRVPGRERLWGRIRYILGPGITPETTPSEVLHGKLSWIRCSHCQQFGSWAMVKLISIVELDNHVLPSQINL